MLANLVNICEHSATFDIFPRMSANIWQNFASICQNMTILLLHNTTYIGFRFATLIFSKPIFDGQVGGGAFASSVSSISFFFPARHKGLALGLNGGLGNLGVPWAANKV